jgi:type II secretory pathway predicted ATPase ExeA
VCCHLGVPGDDQFHYSDPNSLNVCYAEDLSVCEFLPVGPEHQAQYCLTEEHPLCPIYLRRALQAEDNSGQVPHQTFFEFFELREEPFSIVPQPRFLCESRAQQQAHAGLRWLVDRHHGLGLLYGRVGTGKTLLCRTLAEELGESEHNIVALMLTPSQRTEYAFMTELLIAWEIEPERRRSLQDLEEAALDYLIRTVLEREKTVVLIVDEAQTLPRRVLRQVCKLLNWQDGSTQLLQVILAGQPSLQAHLARVPALRDRAIIEFSLDAMTPLDVHFMVGERLRRAGRQGDLFAPSAVQLIYQRAGGMPRRVTILCLLSMWFAYRQGTQYITQDVVQTVIDRTKTGDLFAVPGTDPGQLAAAWAAKDGPSGPRWLPRFLRRLWARSAP